MENSPQTKAGLEPAADKEGTRWPGNSSAPPWLWLLLLGGFAIIFWLFLPKAEVLVDYNPWFLDQVEGDNIKRISVQSTEVHGELRQDKAYERGSSPGSVMVRRFITYFPAEQSIDPVIMALRQRSKTSEPVRIEGYPANTSSGLVWLILLLPTFLILGFIYVMMRRARDQSDGGSGG
jgi:cell division protease FtsH